MATINRENVKNLASMSVEELEQALKVAKAQEKVTDLREALPEFKSEISAVADLKDAVKLARNFVYRFDTANRILHPTDGKRGRPSNK
jgi:hypothetical protein